MERIDKHSVEYAALVYTCSTPSNEYMNTAKRILLRHTATTKYGVNGSVQTSDVIMIRLDINISSQTLKYEWGYRGPDRFSHPIQHLQNRLSNRRTRNV